MESMFYLIEHDWQDINALELVIYQLARGNTFNMRVIGLEEIKRLKEANPDCAITFKPNHLSEADFILLSILFRENNMKVLIEGGSNLFIDDIDIFKLLLFHGLKIIGAAFRPALVKSFYFFSEFGQIIV